MGRIGDLVAELSALNHEDVVQAPLSTEPHFSLTIIIRLEKLVLEDN